MGDRHLNFYESWDNLLHVMKGTLLGSGGDIEAAAAHSPRND